MFRREFDEATAGGRVDNLEMSRADSVEIFESLDVAGGLLIGCEVVLIWTARFSARWTGDSSFISLSFSRVIGIVKFLATSSTLVPSFSSNDRFWGVASRAIGCTMDWVFPLSREFLRLLNRVLKGSVRAFFLIAPVRLSSSLSDCTCFTFTPCSSLGRFFFPSNLYLSLTASRTKLRSSETDAPTPSLGTKYQEKVWYRQEK